MHLHFIKLHIANVSNLPSRVFISNINLKPHTLTAMCHGFL